MADVTKGLLVRLEAEPGQESQLEEFLTGAQALVEQEPGTTAWFALRFGPSSFGIFDVFPDDDARQAHLSGAVGRALGENTGKLFGDPEIHQVDVLASKLPR